MNWFERSLLFAGVMAFAGSAAFAQDVSSTRAAAGAPQALELSGDFWRTHDPSIAKDGDTFYVFATGAAHPVAHGGAPGEGTAAPAAGELPVRCSKGLHEWKICGEVFEEMPAWIRVASPKTKDLWAPDISFFDGQYHLYYAYSLFGKNTSGIGLATNETLDASSPKFKWVDRGLVLQSTEKDDFNAIDPNLIVDAQGRTWLSFGSFWSGIKMRRLDRLTGKLSGDDTKLYSLASRVRPVDAEPAPVGLPANWQAVEAPFILRHDKYYYLFVSWDLCCRGTKSTYRTMVGRSKKVTGPYRDKDGRAMSEGGGSPFLVANERWLGPGGESLLHLPNGDVIVFHAYDAKTGRPALQISTIAWSGGWPSASLQGGAK
jgi:arabinan endo-1,5-alpha-L-arabinosidase